MTESGAGAPVFEEAAKPAAEPAGFVLSLEALAWIAIVAAAFALRLARLDALPMTLDESRRAFDALLVSNNNVPMGWDADLSAVVTSYLFRLFDDTEFVARAFPAVTGAAMAATVWLGGRALGRSGALVAALLLVASPLAMLTSRSAAPGSAGGLLAVVMTVALFAYLARPSAGAAIAFAGALGLALSADAVAVTAALAALTFLVLEPILAADSAVARAWGTLRGNPAHWLLALIVFAAAIELGLTHFGTTLDRLGLGGVTLWAEMFELPRDGRQPEYHGLVLLLYDWPALLAGGAGFAFFGWRLLRRGAESLAPVQLFVLVWLGVAALTLAVATRREAGQLVILIVPLALMGGLVVEALVGSIDWSALRRLWALPAVILALIAYAGLLITESSNIGISTPEQATLALAAGGAGTLLAGCLLLFRHGGGPVLVVAVATVAAVFLAHTGFSLIGNDDAVEPAVDLRARPEIERFRKTVELVVASRSAPVVVDPELRQPLAWYLRDLPVMFSPIGAQAGAAVVPADRNVEGFTELGEPSKIAGSWYPLDLQWRPLWRWLLYREAYGRGEREMGVKIVVPLP